jgi:glycosyltransferase involved in cell wall biosynthesis
VDHLGLSGVVELRGFVAHDELAHVWSQVHALVQPSRFGVDGDTEGGHPTVILEAQAHGVPVLASTHADIPMVVEHGRSGLLSPEGDAEALGRHIVQIDRDRASIARMGRAGHAHAVAHHRREVVLASREEVYDVAIARVSGRRRPP